MYTRFECPGGKLMTPPLYALAATCCLLVLLCEEELHGLITVALCSLVQDERVAGQAQETGLPDFGFVQPRPVSKRRSVLQRAEQSA